MRSVEKKYHSTQVLRKPIFQWLCKKGNDISTSSKDQERIIHSLNKKKQLKVLHQIKVLHKTKNNKNEKARGFLWCETIQGL